MKIQQNLVFRKDINGGELVGFVDLGDPDLNFATLDKPDELASHVLAFYVTGLTTKLKFELGYMATKDLRSYQIKGMFDRALAVLEDTCSLHVMAVVCDGCASNRSFIGMHRPTSKLTGDVIYRTINLFDKSRWIYFFSDTPHLMKTSRNCMYSSGSGTGKKRLMWNDGKEIVWDHIMQAHHQQQNNGLKLIYKLKEEHVYLNPFSKMNVRLATQVLSETVGKYFYNYHPPSYHGTAEFCLMMNNFFDIFNIKNTFQYKSTNKPFLKPLSSPNDVQLKWLKEEFLVYFQKWHESINNRVGEFSKSDRGKMFLSHQTYLGIRMNVLSLIGLTNYLFREKEVQGDIDDTQEFLLTGKISQDSTEENFGRHRAAGRRNDNPSLHQFGYDSNIIRLSRNIMPVTGNTEGAHKKNKRSWSAVDNSPLPKKKR